MKRRPGPRSIGVCSITREKMMNNKTWKEVSNGGVGEIILGMGAESRLKKYWVVMEES